MLEWSKLGNEDSKKPFSKIVKNQNTYTVLDGGGKVIVNFTSSQIGWAVWLHVCEDRYIWYNPNSRTCHISAPQTLLKALRNEYDKKPFSKIVKNQNTYTVLDDTGKTIASFTSSQIGWAVRLHVCEDRYIWYNPNSRTCHIYAPQTLLKALRQGDELRVA